MVWKLTEQGQNGLQEIDEIRSIRLFAGGRNQGDRRRGRNKGEGDCHEAIAKRQKLRA